MVEVFEGYVASVVGWLRGGSSCGGRSGGRGCC